MEFLLWLLHTLHSALGGSKKTDSSQVHRIFQGAMRIYSRKLPPTSEVGGWSSDVSMDTSFCCVECVEAAGERRVSRYAVHTYMSHLCLWLQRK